MEGSSSSNSAPAPPRISHFTVHPNTPFHDLLIVDLWDLHKQTCAERSWNSAVVAFLQSTFTYNGNRPHLDINSKGDVDVAIWKLKDGGVQFIDVPAQRRMRMLMWKKRGSVRPMPRIRAARRMLSGLAVSLDRMLNEVVEQRLEEWQMIHR